MTQEIAFQWDTASTISTAWPQKDIWRQSWLWRADLIDWCRQVAMPFNALDFMQMMVTLDQSLLIWLLSPLPGHQGPQLLTSLCLTRNAIFRIYFRHLVGYLPCHLKCSWERQWLSSEMRILQAWQAWTAFSTMEKAIRLLLYPQHTISGQMWSMKRSPATSS